MIPKSFIQDLLNRIDIVDVVDRYVPLKKAGANFVACCPFHNEKSPSFTVSQSKQFYHCFGCGAHGTAIGFVMEHAGLGYVEAIEELARNIGLEVPHERPAAGEGTQKVAPDLYQVMQTATRYYRDQLKQSSRAIDYLKRRGLSGEIAARFGIGYAPDGWQNLAAAFPDYQSSMLAETGLVIVGDEGKRYDRFRDRIMFPIVNARGQVVGFGGRVLDKGDHMDVVALAQHGVEYAVATLGTATTPYHVQKLLRLADEIVFSFDGDRAGQKAAWRALENALPHLQDGKRISFLFLPAEHDPDSFIREFGSEAFEQRVREAMPLSGYLLREISAELDLRTQEGRSQLLQRAKPLLMAITAPATALLLRKEVAALSGVSQEELEALYEIKPVARAPRPPLQKAARTPPSAHRLLLQCLIAQPELGAQLPDEWCGEGGEAEAVSAMLFMLREAEFALSGPVLVQSFQGTVHEKTLAAVEADMLDWGEGFDVAAEFAGLLGRLEEEQRRQQSEYLQAKGLSNMTAAEREQYLRLLKRG